MKANRIWFKINNHYLYEDFIFIQDENRIPKVVSLKDDLGNYYIGFVNATLDWEDWKHNESIVQRVNIGELIDYLQSEIGLQNLLKSKETAFRIKQKSNADEDIVEVVDSTYVDTYGWHDPAKLGKLCREQEEYLNKLNNIRNRDNTNIQGGQVNKMAEGDKFAHDLLEEINKELKNKLKIQDINKILDITDSFSDEFKTKIVKGMDTRGKKIYCIILTEDISNKQFMECIRTSIATKDSFVFFYNKRMWLD